jgi:hypothetical protein
MPPGSETGLGWLRGTIKTLETADVLDTLLGYFGPHQPRQGGTRWYRSAANLAERSVMVAWDGVGQASGTVMVEVKQTALDGLGWERSVELLSDLASLGLRASRLDLYYDDRERIASPGEVWEALSAGQGVTHSQSFERHEDQDHRSTANLGARSSLRYLRVYDKPDESGDRVRWEIELHDESARSAVSLLLSLAARLSPSSSTFAVGRTSDLSSQAGAFVLGLVADFVDFRQTVQGDLHGSRRPRLAWWARLLGSTVRVRLAAAVVVDSLERRAAWLARQAAPTLAAVWMRYGDGWLNALLSNGLDRAEQSGDMRRLQWQPSA